MRIVICGSMQFSEQMLAVQNVLTKKGHEVYRHHTLNPHCRLAGNK